MTLGGIEGSVQSSNSCCSLYGCHCACSSEIGTCIINAAGIQAAHKNNENTRFWSNLVKRRFINTYLLKFNFQCKKKKFFFNNLTDTIPLQKY
jgi:hypothetical protein